MKEQVVIVKRVEAQEAYEEITNNFSRIITDLDLTTPFFEFLQLFNFYKGYGSNGETLGFELEPKNTITKTQERFPNILAIAASIANMPSKSLLSLAYTKDLEDEWQYQRSLSRYLARGFIVVGLKLNINPFSRKHQPEMSQGDKKVCLQDAYKYLALWDLFQVGWPYITERVSDMPFNTALELFCEVVREEIDFQFEARVPEFFQLLVDEQEKLWSLIANPKENRDQINRLIDSEKIRVSKWLAKVSPTLVEASKNDKDLEEKLVAHGKCCIESALAMKQSLSSRNSKGKINKSEQWRNGKRYVLHRNKPKNS